MSDKRFSLYSPQSPADAPPLYREQTLTVANQILLPPAYARLDALSVGDRMTTFDGYIWERTQ